MIIGVTGQLGSGKSTVARKILKLKKGVLLDADKIAHGLLDKDKIIKNNIISHFGNKILNKDGRIDSKRLAGIVFSDKKKLKFLCRAVHPKVIDKIKESSRDALKKDKDSVVIIDAPLLIEAGLDNFCDLVIVVAAALSNILSRVKGLSRPQALKRLRAQMPIEEKQKSADYVIQNNGSIRELERKIETLVERILTYGGK